LGNDALINEANVIFIYFLFKIRNPPEHTLEE